MALPKGGGSLSRGHFKPEIYESNTKDLKFKRLTMKIAELLESGAESKLCSMMVVSPIESVKCASYDVLPGSDNVNFDQYGTNLDDLRDCKMVDFISSLLVDTLRIARQNLFPGKMLVPTSLPERIAKDILHMSQDEPCGIRGCGLDLVLEDDHSCTRLGKTQVDPLTVNTFDVTVILMKETPRWFVSKLQSYLRTNGESTTIIKPGYKLVKRKLYRKESRITVEEHS